MAQQIEQIQNKSGERPFYQMNIEEVEKALSTSFKKGLSSRVAKKKLKIDGPNSIQRKSYRGPLVILFSQFRNYLIYILFTASIIAAALGDWKEGLVILAIVIVNGVIGFIQEIKAERAIELLQSLTSPHCKCIRSGEEIDLSAKDLVVGDVVLLEAGSVVPADLRIVEDYALSINEAPLTGESIPVHKTIDPLTNSKLILSDQENCVFMGTHVLSGRGKGVVIKTGARTEFGKIADLLDRDIGKKTPLQAKIDRLGPKLTWWISGVCLFIFLYGLYRGESIRPLFFSVLALAVAAIPEALPAVMTMGLSLGAKRLAEKNSLVRKLLAVEGLGPITIICTDKTGTLTENKMKVESIVLADEDKLSWLRLNMGLNNDAKIIKKHVSGDPTEVALIDYLRTEKVPIDSWPKAYPRTLELPFSSETKIMATINQIKGHHYLFLKGASEAVEYYVDNLESKKKIQENTEKLGLAGERVLCFAFKKLEEVPELLDLTELDKHRDFQFIGLTGLMDPPRPEVAKAIADCKKAHITPVMITGDHPTTAQAVARNVGLIGHSDNEYLTGEDLTKLDESSLMAKLEKVRIFARVNPEHKIKLVEAYQKLGHQVAMTGDGINDAPALKAAHIGVSMGTTGTEVAKEASDIVLLDDNFSTLVHAVALGRQTFTNILRFIRFVLTGNFGEIATIFLAPLLGLPLPLLPIHILWVNLLTDGLPGLALMMEKEGPEIMERPPIKSNFSILNAKMAAHILFYGSLIALITLFTPKLIGTGLDSKKYYTITFTILTFCQLFMAIEIKNETQSLFSKASLTNPHLWVSIVFTIALQMVVIYSNFGNQYLHTKSLGPIELAICFSGPILLILIKELEKFLARRPKRKISS